MEEEQRQHITAGQAEKDARYPHHTAHPVAEQRRGGQRQAHQVPSKPQQQHHHYGCNGDKGLLHLPVNFPPFANLVSRPCVDQDTENGEAAERTDDQRQNQVAEKQDYDEIPFD